MVVSLTVTHVTYTVTFAALGLPGATNWSVTLGGVVHSSPNNGTISFTEANGTYTYAAATVSGYNITPRTGSVHVNGAGMNVGIGFAATSSSSSSSSSSSPFSTTVTLLLLVVAAVVGLVVGLLIGRRRKGVRPRRRPGLRRLPGVRSPGRHLHLLPPGVPHRGQWAEAARNGAPCLSGGAQNPFPSLPGAWFAARLSVSLGKEWLQGHSHPRISWIPWNLSPRADVASRGFDSPGSPARAHGRSASRRRGAPVPC